MGTVALPTSGLHTNIKGVPAAQAWGVMKTLVSEGGALARAAEAGHVQKRGWGECVDQERGRGDSTKTHVCLRRGEEGGTNSGQGTLVGNAQTSIKGLVAQDAATER